MPQPATAVTDRERLRAEKAALVAALVACGITGALVRVIGHSTGRPYVWASVPYDDAAPHASTMAAQGFTVLPGALTIAFTTGEHA